MTINKVGQPREQTDQADEANYRALLGAAGAGISETDADGCFLYVNDRYCELVGRRREALIGRATFFDLTHPDDVADNRRLLDISRRTNCPFSMEKRYLWPDGTVIWVSAFASWRASADAGRGRWIIGAIDITERKQAEQAMRESEERKSFLLRLGDRLRSLGDPLEVMDTAARMLGEYLQANRVSYGEVTSDGRVMSGRDFVQGVSSLPRYFHLGRVAPGVLESFLHDRTSVAYDVMDDHTLTDEMREAWQMASIRAHVSVPLRKNGRLVAAFAVHQAEPRRWTETEIALIEETADRTWGAVEQARAEAALRSSESHLAAIFAQAAVGLSEIGLDGSFHHVNDELCRLMGRTRQELLELTVADVTHPDDLSKSLGAIDSLLEEGTPVSVDKRYLKPDGTHVFANSTLTRLDEKPYGPRAILVVTVDLTARKCVEQELENELADNRRLQEISTRLIPANDVQQLFRELVAAAVEITRADRGTLQLFNPRTQSLELLAERGFNGHLHGVFTTVDDNSSTSCAEALRSQKRVLVRNYETDPRVAGTEEARWHLSLGVRAAQSTPLISRSGHLLGMISTHWLEEREPEERQLRLIDILSRQAADLLERHQAEEALRTSEERYRTLFSSIDSGFCVLEVYFDEEGRAEDCAVLEANPAFERQTGLPQNLIGRRIRQMVPEVEDQWLETYGQIALTGEPQRFVQQAMGLGGQWFDVYAFRLGNPDDHRVAVLFNDISSRIKTEQELKEADRRKNEFLAMLAHELRNPLAPIRTGLEVLRMSQGQQETTERMLELMERQMQQMVRLVDDLLDISRITQGKVQVKRQRCNLGTVIENAVEGSRPLLGASDIDLTVDIPSGAVYIDADPARLAQVLSNLLNNAAKYTDTGGQVWLQAAISGKDLQIRVRDTGSGIPAQMLSSIFDAFIQVDNSLARSRGGLGVGLSLVKTLVELHGGTVSAHSEGAGKGSEFIIRLPGVVCPPGVAEPAPALTKDDQQEGYRVLIIDDNVDAADALAMILRLMGSEVRVANNGRTGLELTEEFRPDLVLLDLGMPEMDGYETARRLRKHHWGKNVTLSALTGWGQDEDRRRCREAGFDHHLVKPVDQAALRNLLKKLPPPTDN